MASLNSQHICIVLYSKLGYRKFVIIYSIWNGCPSKSSKHVNKVLKKQLRTNIIIVFCFFFLHFQAISIIMSQRQWQAKWQIMWISFVVIIIIEKNVRYVFMTSIYAKWHGGNKQRNKKIQRRRNNAWIHLKAASINSYRAHILNTINL